MVTITVRQSTVDSIKNAISGVRGMAKVHPDPPPEHDGGEDSSTSDMPPHPLTLDGAAMLHQMFRVRRAAWRRLAPADQEEFVREAESVLGAMDRNGAGSSALFSLLGHKGDLLLLHFRKDFEDLNRAEMAVSALRLSEYLEPTTSYLSVVELGLYDSTVKLYQELLAEGITPDSPDWAARVQGRSATQAEAMAPRLDPAMPPHKHVCFYPMDKKRGELRNWYSVPIEKRRDMMREHGMIGRRYAGRVKQIISGSIGFDDWEWGVDLFADDPLVFKQLIYEMRFDEASAAYGLFGPFYVGLRLRASELGKWLALADPAFGSH